MELQERAKLGTKGRPSDEVEGVQFAVRWEPINGALGVGLSRDDVRVADGELAIVSRSSSLVPVMTILMTSPRRMQMTWMWRRCCAR